MHSFRTRIPSQFCGGGVREAFNQALDRTEECFRVIAYPGYHNEKGMTTFSHLHGDQYATFIWFLSNSLYRNTDEKTACDKLLQLNKLLNNVFISYKCGLPDHFLLIHPIGTILGNANYSDFLVVRQGVTVNTAHDKEGNPAPYLGRGLNFGAHAKIFGNASVGDRVSIGAGAMIYQTEVPDDHVVISKEGKVIVRKRKREFCAAQELFNVTI